MQTYIVCIQISGLPGPGKVTPVGTVIQLDPTAKDTLIWLELGVIKPYAVPAVPPTTAPPLREFAPDPAATPGPIPKTNGKKTPR